MKKLFCSSVTYLIFVYCFAQQGAKQFTLTGKISNQQNAYLYLQYEDKDGQKIKDSCLIKGGDFVFSGYISEPTLAIFKGNLKIMDDAKNLNITTFYLEPGKMTAVVAYDHFKETVITGSKTQQEYESLQHKYATIDQQSPSVVELFADMDREYIISHPDSYLSGQLLDMRKTRWPHDTVKMVFAALSRKIQCSASGNKIAASLSAVENNSAGRKAKEFVSTDINGRAISLSGFKGKYVLLDFWGSWCEPCRASTPHLIKLFNQYHQNGLEVIGVAEEYTKTDVLWREAIKKDGTYIWYNVLDTRNSQNADNADQSRSIVKAYAISSFPTKILIDREGTIIGRYGGLTDEGALDKKLQEIFR